MPWFRIIWGTVGVLFIIHLSILLWQMGTAWAMLRAVIG